MNQPTESLSLTDGYRGTSAATVPAVGIIVVNWRGLDDTRECCESLLKLTYPHARVYIVDNASGDGSVETLRQEFPTFRCVENLTNLGFAGANNQLIQHATADGCDYVLLLNNDTIVDRSFLEPLLEVAEGDPRIGMVSPKIYFASRPTVIWFAGGKIDTSAPFLFGHIGEDEDDVGQFDVRRETTWVSGCSLLARTELIKDIGLLDETFGYYCEDVEWCLRAKRAGWKLWYEPRSKVWHKIGRSSGRGKLPVLYYNCRNVLLLARRMSSNGERRSYSKWAFRHAFHRSCYSGDKAGLLEAILHGILGRGGIAGTIGKSWWSNAIVSAERAWRKVFRILSAPQRTGP